MLFILANLRSSPPAAATLSRVEEVMLRPRGGRLRVGLALALVAAAAGCGDAQKSDPALEPAAAKKPPPEEPGKFDLHSRPKVVQLEGATRGQPKADPNDDAPSPGAQSDAEVRAELREARQELRSFKHHLSSTAFLQ